ncbi:MAG: hypothetical protein IKD87_07085 [Oscillospiraceae bacterium]|nr:hypothetical protein [Oscillospiraceae bacterium]
MSYAGTDAMSAMFSIKTEPFCSCDSLISVCSPNTVDDADTENAAEDH